MNHRLSVVPAILTLAAGAATGASLPPVPDNPQVAQTSLGFNINARCPDLRIVEGGTRAVVVFWVPRRGLQSQIAIKTSSGASELDAAAISCVSRLRFAPAVTLGDGESVDSWQQIALGWVDPAMPAAGRAMTAAPPSATARAPQAVTAAPSEPPASPTRAGSGNPGRSVTVHVCVDEGGRLAHEPAIVQSSGVDAVDQAALKIAAAGSAYYRPSTPSSGSAIPSGCAELAIRFDTK